ncbi:MAG: PAS domain S-box protein [Candidatus Marinimicrobia bacterium]|nr:PAS domain S-box protein [Candidatus Neomarinimicrobiota bacterium]
MLLTGAHILLIEHDPRVIDSIRQVVGDTYTLEIETSGRAGIKKASLKEYDLYLIGTEFPDMQGLDILSAILKIFPEAICVMMEHDPGIDIIMKSAHMGGYDFLKKPIRHDKLERLIPRALERRWYIQEARRLKDEKDGNLVAISEEQSRLRSVINSIDDGLIITNQRREIIFTNPRFLKLVGVTRDIPVGETIFEILPKKLQEQINGIMDNENSSCSIKEEIVIEPPAKLVIMANSTPIIDDGGQLLGVVSVLRDISEIKALELSKSEFINMVVHELKAPLGAIKGYLEMVVERQLGNEDALYENYLRRSLSRSEAMLALLQDLLNIFRMDNRTVRREIERFDAGELLRETLDFFQGDIQSRSLQLQVDIEEGLFIRADREEIRRVYTNLISNAIKYNKDKGDIDVIATRTGPFLSLRVRDTGIGMKEEDKERLFEEFYRAKNRYTRQISGTGLGTTILKKIVDEYGGKILVESEYEKGSVFTVQLPLAEI